MKATKIVPSGVTTLGLVLGMTALATQNPWFMAASQLCDVLDGYLARRLNAVTDVGGELDWAVDVLLAAVCAGMISPWLLAPLAAWQTLARVKGWRTSGRIVATVAWCWWVFAR